MAKRIGIWMKHDEIGSTWMNMFQCPLGKAKEPGNLPVFRPMSSHTALFLTQGQRLAAIAVHSRPGPIRGTSSS